MKIDSAPDMSINNHNIFCRYFKDTGWGHCVFSMIIIDIKKLTFDAVLVLYIMIFKTNNLVADHWLFAFWLGLCLVPNCQITQAHKLLTTLKLSPTEWNYTHEVSLLLLLESSSFTPVSMAIASKFLLTVSLFGNVFKYQCYRYTCSTRDDYMFKAYDYRLAYMPRQTITSTDAQIRLQET